MPYSWTDPPQAAGSGACPNRPLRRPGRPARRRLHAATRQVYRADWADWTAWCGQHGQQPLPAAPEAIAGYLASLAATHGRLLLLGYAGALRRSELVAIAREHVSFTPEGLRRYRQVERGLAGPGRSGRRPE